MKSLLATVALLIAVVIGALLMRLGAFKPVTLTIAEAGPFHIIFRHHHGAYHKIVPEIETVEKWANGNGEPCQTSFGEYIDDPNSVDEDRLNSNGGCLVTGSWADRLEKMPEGMNYREIARRKYVVADFEGAPSIGPQKVYPRATAYIAENGLKIEGPVIEMYERTAEGGIKTHYYFPVR